VAIPLGVITCVTGVSGSGKSTLILDTLYKALAQKLTGGRERPGEHRSLSGLEHVDKVIHIDQSPIGRTPRSNPATYSGVFTPIRDLFAMLPRAKSRGYRPGRYSFNVRGGRCEACEGDGIIRSRCTSCGCLRHVRGVPGAAVQRETLEVAYKGRASPTSWR